MNFPVIKNASYVLVDVPDMVVNNGTTQTLEKKTNSESEYLNEIKKHLRTFDEVVAYPPNQTYIGNLPPEELSNIKRPWHLNKVEGADRFGKFGEIMTQSEFYGLLKLSDVFDLVILEDSFTESVREMFKKHPLLNTRAEELKPGEKIEDIEKLVHENIAAPIYQDGKLVGCVKRAHEFDENLSSHVMLENLSVKASGVLALMHLMKNSKMDGKDIDYLIECSEEAVGDMNQRGGGNLAKACGEIAGISGATGIDMRGFCAGPAHALITASALVKSGIYKNVVVFAGGCTAKLGMNGKDHVKKDLPILEDCLGGFAILVSENDGVNPVVRTDIIGRHTIADGAAPQAVIKALVLDPLARNDMKITDVNKFAPEMQIPDITEPAGAGDVPTQNYKMIGALAVKSGQLERKQLPEFVKKHGYPGFAPTQGHIPSGVPIVGYGIEHILNGKLDNFMIIGKGSLFLGRMTNLFDGVSVLIEKNKGLKEEAPGISKDEIKELIADEMKKFAQQITE
ncbi:glycine reductase [Clostridium fermenticellae]|uniref:Glycine reductase n=1 Tax=Clostridium fermenticellae TaxID=2068654 RepID=A0A386H683_9CLOT|nr:glycine/sarcosine/betaine reductase complex component C subunit beta [Clostridium fermenticellae]AYD41219.1 glycine reductase [Clostridium fermenticellae]